MPAPRTFDKETSRDLFKKSAHTIGNMLVCMLGHPASRAHPVGTHSFGQFDLNSEQSVVMDATRSPKTKKLELGAAQLDSMGLEVEGTLSSSNPLWRAPVLQHSVIQDAAQTMEPQIISFFSDLPPKAITLWNKPDGVFISDGEGGLPQLATESTLRRQTDEALNTVHSLAQLAGMPECGDLS